jgi:C4-dicarboxylate transporter DctM subunit
MPVVILGGLYGGLFTPTEAAAAACGYAMLYGLIVGRAAFLRELLPTAMRAMNLTGVILFLIAASACSSSSPPTCTGRSASPTLSSAGG